jgi:hypothetical protein
VFFDKPFVLFALQFYAGKVFKGFDLGAFFAGFALFRLQNRLDMWCKNAAGSR